MVDLPPVPQKLEAPRVAAAARILETPAARASSSNRCPAYDRQGSFAPAPEEWMGSSDVRKSARNQEQTQAENEPSVREDT